MSDSIDLTKLTTYTHTCECTHLCSCISMRKPSAFQSLPLLSDDRFFALYCSCFSLCVFLADLLSPLISVTSSVSLHTTFIFKRKKKEINFSGVDEDCMFEILQLKSWVIARSKKTYCCRLEEENKEKSRQIYTIYIVG